MSRDPRPGEVFRLPGVLLPCCPACHATTVLFMPGDESTFRYECAGCQRYWHVTRHDASVFGWRWIRKDDRNADTPAV